MHRLILKIGISSTCVCFIILGLCRHAGMNFGTKYPRVSIIKIIHVVIYCMSETLRIKNYEVMYIPKGHIV